MEIAKSCHYAVRGLVYLTRRPHPEAPVMLRDIAEAIQAPEAFLSKIFQMLRVSGIVRSHRGTIRGYGLARPPAEVSLYDVVVATAGSATVQTGALVKREMGAPFASFWTEIEELLANKLRSTTIQDLSSAPPDESSPPQPN